MRTPRHLLAAALTGAAALLGAALPQAATAATVNFNSAPAVVGQSANTIYAADPGLVFARPIPSTIRNGGGCGTRVTAGPAGQGNVAGLVCGGSVEFPDPPSLFGTFTPTTRTNLSMKVGHFGSQPHTMELKLYDEAGQLVNSQEKTTTTGGVTFTVNTGSPNVLYFLLDDNDQYPGTNQVWVDDLQFDDPPVAGNAGFDVSPTAGTATTSLVQGASSKAVDVTLSRINGSAGVVDVTFSGLPAGVTATKGSSTNGFSVLLSADPRAPLTGLTDSYFTATIKPHDLATGTVTHKLTFAVRVTPAITVSITGAAHLPTCATNTVYFSIAPHAGPATATVTGLPPGVTATLDGTPIGGGLAITDGGTRELGFVQTDPVSTPIHANLHLEGSWYTSSLEHVTSKYQADAGLDIGTAGSFDVSPSALRTPQELQPGTNVELKGDDLCTTANAGVQFGSKDAIVPIHAAASRVIRLDTPRSATSGTIDVIPDMAHPNVRIKSAQYVTVDSYRNTAGFAFHNYKPNLTFDQMTNAFGYDETHYSPNICDTFTFGLISCKVSTPLPDPWAIAVLTVANATMGGGSGGACFGYSKTSEQLRTGQRSLLGFGNDSARNAWELDWRMGAGGALQERINSNQLTQLSSQYLGFYAKSAVGNVLSQSASGLRGEIEDYLRKGDHPMISMRDGGSIDKLHVVVAYDIEPDPEGAGGYYIDVLDSNMPFAQQGFDRGDDWDETNNAKGAHAYALGKSRIHVRGDGSWNLPSSNMGASTIANIIVSGKDMPGNDPTLIGAKEALKDGLVILLGWTAAGLLDDSPAVTPDAPSHVTQVESGGRKLYSSPGVINTDPKTALRATPWAPASGDASSDGLLLAQGPGAEYTVSVTGDKTAAQSRTVLGDDMIARVNTDAQAGVTDELHVAPHSNEVAFEPGGKGSSPLDVSMMVRAGDGSTRTAQVGTKTPAGGSDAVSFNGSERGVVIDHQGPATTVDLTLSVTGANAVPQAVETSVPVGKNATTTISTSSWKDLGKGKLTAKSGGKSRVLHARRKAGKGAKVTKVTVSGGSAHAQVTVPSNVPAGMTTLTLAVKRGKRLVGTSSASAGGPGSRTVSLSLPAKAKKGDQLIVVATTILQSGQTYSSTTSSRKAKVK